MNCYKFELFHSNVPNTHLEMALKQTNKARSLEIFSRLGSLSVKTKKSLFIKKEKIRSSFLNSVPDGASFNLTCWGVSYTEIQCEWESLDAVYWNGVPQGNNFKYMYCF